MADEAGERSELDPFDLPAWLGEGPVSWEPESGISRGARVPGRLTDGTDTLAMDLLAVDEAYPAPVASDVVRRRAHQSWQHGQVLLVEVEGRATLAVPGRAFTADRVLDVIGRLAKAVGAPVARYAVLLRLGE